MNDEENLFHLESYEPNDPDKIVIWKGELVDKFNTEYADIILLKTQLYGHILFMDNCLQSTEKDEYMYHTILVHALGEHINIDKVAIFGGGEGCTAREVLKYNPSFVLQVDIDHEFVKWCSNTLCWDEGALKDPRLHLIYDDAWKVIKKTPYSSYDYIIIDLFDPDSSNIDKYIELLIDAIKWLKPGGCLVAYTGMIHIIDPPIYKICEKLVDKIGDYCDIIDYFTTFIPSFGGECSFVYYSVKEEESSPHLAIDVSQL
jgi:spermidine synthase